MLYSTVKILDLNQIETRVAKSTDGHKDPYPPPQLFILKNTLIFVVIKCDEIIDSKTELYFSFRCFRSRWSSDQSPHDATKHIPNMI